MTVQDVEAMLAQLQADRLAPYWADRGDQLDGVQSWLESLRDHLESNQTSAVPLWAQGLLVATGGWCAPIAAIYDAAALDTNDFTVVGFPEVSTLRGGFDFTDRRTDAEKAADAAMQARTTRMVDQFARARSAAIDAACVTALAEHWDVYVYEPPTPYDLRRAGDRDLIYLRSVGIEFRPAEHPVPTIVHHACPDGWEYDDWDDE